jgi:hypothetical protein
MYVSAVYATSILADLVPRLGKNTNNERIDWIEGPREAKVINRQKGQKGLEKPLLGSVSLMVPHRISRGQPLFITSPLRRL